MRDLALQQYTLQHITQMLASLPHTDVSFIAVHNCHAVKHIACRNVSFIADMA